MGRASTTVYIREQVKMTPAQLCTNANLIMQTIADAGMLPVAHADYAGQTETFVTVATGAPNETVYAATYASGSFALMGERLYRHPNHNFYIRICFYEEGPGTTDRGLCIQLYLANGLTSAGVLENSREVSLKVAIGSIPSASYAQGIVGRPLTFRVSCSEDHFVMCSTSALESYYNSSSYINMASGSSPLSFAMLKSGGVGDRWLCIAPTDYISGGTNVYGASATWITSQAGAGLPKRYLWELSSGVLSALGSGITGWAAMQEVGTVSDSQGVRVAQIAVSEGGSLIYYPAGVMHGGAGVSMGIYTLSLDGVLERDYVFAPPFGQTNFVSYDMPFANIPYLLLPWGDFK